MSATAASFSGELSEAKRLCVSTQLARFNYEPTFFSGECAIEWQE